MKLLAAAGAIVTTWLGSAANAPEVARHLGFTGHPPIPQAGLGAA